MRVTIVLPTYAQDAALCAQAIRGVERLRRLCPDDRIRLVIADDAAAPLPETPQGADERLTTTFPRSGNLNGIACIRGLLDTYAAAALVDDDWVVKMDSDTYLCHLEWIRDREEGHVYNHNDIANRIFGSSYALTPATAKAARAIAERQDIEARIAKGYGPEDLCISCLCRMTGNGWHMVPCHLGGVFAPGQAPQTLGGNLVASSREEALRRPFVTFKDFWTRDAKTNARRVSSATEALTAFADFADGKPIPADATAKVERKPEPPAEAEEATPETDTNPKEPKK